MADNPNIPEFETLDSYKRFASSVLNGSRYALNDDDRAFLDTVRATTHSMDRQLNAGTWLFRAQLGCGSESFPNYQYDENGEVVSEEEDTVAAAHPKSRMIPKAEYAVSGRANPQGIPVLYLANRIETAICEIRPWIGSSVSVAEFHTKRDLNLLDVTKATSLGPHYNPFRNLPNPSVPMRKEKESRVWSDINAAFSKPVNQLDGQWSAYVPTQILAELFRESGYDGVMYKSNFGGRVGHNVVLFDLDDAECKACFVHHIESIKIEFDQRGEGWDNR